MKLTIAPIKKRQRSILLTFLLLLTLPLFVFGLLENKSFDIRNRAFEEVELSELNPCIISFPNVNPYTLEVNNTVRIQVDALSSQYGIKDISISDGYGNTLFTKSYEDTSLTKITESFPYTPQTARAYNLTGVMTDMSNTKYSCVISSPYDIQGVKAIALNSMPEFTTSPKSSSPSQSIQTGITYEYTLKAQDIDGDTINYSYSFTKGQDWLKPTVINDGGNGQLSIKFRGSTNEPGSYLANVFIHDGYSKHLSSQSWVISVSPKGNDNPVITIIEPEKPVVIKDQSNLRLSWEAVDNNRIIRYEIYISSNPVNELTWKEIDTNVSSSTTNYTVDLSDIQDGTYRIIIRAIDDQDPAGIGMDISEEILISRDKEVDEPDDKVVLPQPQVINISPTSSDEINNTNPTIKASLIATENAVIDSDSILLKIDDGDVTQKIQINKISDSEYTVIYLPEDPLEVGLHKVSIYFKDSNDAEVEREWTFTISGEADDDDNFKIFGFEIPKRTGYIIGGGIALIALAILTPLIIMSLWKDRNKEVSTENTALPQSIPPTQDLPIPEPTTPMKELVEDEFEPPEPELPGSDDNTVFEAPLPSDDFTNMYEEIKEVEEKNSKES